MAKSVGYARRARAVRNFSVLLRARLAGPCNTNHTAPMSFGKKKNIASSGWEVQRFLLLLKGLNELDIKSRLDLV